MIPVISIVGKESNIGKTTLICGIISELKKRKYKVATIKHTKDDFEIDHREKDTWKHSEAGSDIVIISSPKKIAKIEKVEEIKLDDIIKDIKNVDIIITEGYKKENKPKIELVKNQEIISKYEELLAIVSEEYINTHINQFKNNNIVEIVDLIEYKFLKSFK